MGDDMSLHVDPARAREQLIDAAREAGEIALKFFRQGERTDARVDFKEGGSPVTEADIAVNDFLRIRLSKVFEGAGWLSEENEDSIERMAHAELLIVDPIDGTRAFMAGDPRWAVSIALVMGDRPIAGVVHVPALEETYAAASSQGSTLNGAPIKVSERNSLADARLAGPKPIAESIARAAGVCLALQPKIPSLAYRMALVASGALDLALASERSHDWDIAAADLILGEAGGALVGTEGRALRYNRPETRHGVLFGASTRMIGSFVEAARLASGGRLA